MLQDQKRAEQMISLSMKLLEHLGALDKLSEADIELVKQSFIAVGCAAALDHSEKLNTLRAEFEKSISETTHKTNGI